MLTARTPPRNEASSRPTPACIHAASLSQAPRFEETRGLVEQVAFWSIHGRYKVAAKPTIVVELVNPVLFSSPGTEPRKGASP